MAVNVLLQVQELMEAHNVVEQDMYTKNDDKLHKDYACLDLFGSWEGQLMHHLLEEFVFP